MKICFGNCYVSSINCAETIELKSPYFSQFIHVYFIIRFIIFLYYYANLVTNIIIAEMKKGNIFNTLVLSKLAFDIAN